MDESQIVAPFLTAALFQCLVSLALVAWGRWVARRHEGRFWRWAAWMPFYALILALVGIGITSVMLVRSFGAVSNVDPSMKATLLARGISHAMNATALLVLPSLALYLASVVIFVIGTARD